LSEKSCQTLVNYSRHNFTIINPHVGFAEAGQSPLDDEEMPQEDLLQRRETLDLVRAFYKITDPKQRRKVLELIKAMSTAEALGE
jgi:hypothetical protein